MPVLQNPPLARALYREVEIGQMIPDEFFAAVAEVLAFVFRHAGRRGGGRRHAPKRRSVTAHARLKSAAEDADDGPACESEARRFAAAPPAAACRHRPVTASSMRGR